jgi:hypothetical protein
MTAEEENEGQVTDAVRNEAVRQLEETMSESTVSAWKETAAECIRTRVFARKQFLLDDKDLDLGGTIEKMVAEHLQITSITRRRMFWEQRGGREKVRSTFRRKRQTAQQGMKMAFKGKWGESIKEVKDNVLQFTHSIMKKNVYIIDWMRDITSTDDITSRRAVNHDKSPPTPEYIITKMREDKDAYSGFADYMLRTVHGKCGYSQKAGSRSRLLSDFVPISQEAFALLLYKNGYEDWLWKYNEGVSSEDTDSSDRRPGYKYTSAMATEGTAFTCRNGGWSPEGMKEFNRLYDLVEQSRTADNGSFDTHYKTHWREHRCVSKYKKRKRGIVPTVTSIRDDLVHEV